jgi:hypothetical protein
MTTTGSDLKTVHCEQAETTARCAGPAALAPLCRASSPCAAARLTAAAMAKRQEHRGSMAAAVLLTVAAALAAPAAAQNTTASGVTTGLSALTINNYPLPPAFKCAIGAWACVTQATSSALL